MYTLTNFFLQSSHIRVNLLSYERKPLINKSNTTGMMRIIWPGTRPIFSVLQSHCSRLSIGLLSYDNRSTLLQLDKRTFLDGHTRPIFFRRSSRIRVDLLSYESKPTYKWEQYDWRAAKKIGRVYHNLCESMNCLLRPEYCLKDWECNGW